MIPRRLLGNASVGVCLLACLLTTLVGCASPQEQAPRPAVTVPTASPVIPSDELPGRLLTVLTTNLKDPTVAACVRDRIVSERSAGALSDSDLDNYVRNLVTDPMHAALIKIQNSGEGIKP